MVIQFPNQKRKPASVESQKTNLTGLYLLLAFSVLYLMGVLLTQHSASRQAASTKPLAASSPAH